MPIPKGRKLPSALYKKVGLLDTMMTKRKINNTIDANVGFFLINSGFMIVSLLYYNNVFYSDFVFIK